MHNDIRLEIRSASRLLQAVRGLAKGYLEAYGFSASRVEEGVLALNEACANVMRHAYDGCEEEHFVLRFSASEDWIEIELRDEGCPAPREKVARPLGKCNDTDRLTPGGLGVPLMYTVFDEVDFAPGLEKGNRVVMRLRRPATNEAV